MEDLATLYEAIASGTTAAADHMYAARHLQGLARDRASGTVQDKRGAVRVAASLGTHHGLAILIERDMLAENAKQVGELYTDATKQLRSAKIDLDEGIRRTAEFYRSAS